MNYVFAEENPFPLIHLESYDYAAAKLHAEAVDQFLGYQCVETEKQIQQNCAYHPQDERPIQYWVGLDLQTLQTPYIEIRLMLSLLPLQAGEIVIDLGCAYGRMALVLGRHYKRVKFIGYEKVSERVQEGLRIIGSQQIKNVTLLEYDLQKLRPAVADYYFLYDFGSKAAISKTLEELRETAKRRSLTVIARGRASRDIVEREHPWLSGVKQPQHCGNFSIYYS